MRPARGFVVGLHSFSHLAEQRCVLMCAGEDVDPKVVNACFGQMDEDGSKAVDFDEFCNFFGVRQS